MVKLSFWRRWVCRNQMKGQSLVDFALFAPILILLLAGTVDFGNGFQTWVSLTNAVREGARRGASFGDASVICKRVQEELASDGITINCGAGSNVTISYPILNDGA